MELLFWIVIGLVVYIFGAYVVLLVLLAKLWGKPVRKEQIWPSVSIVLAVFNEEKHIESKIKNCIAFDYPPENVEIIIVSDGSTDRTNDLVATFQSSVIKFILLGSRSGKTNAQNVGVEAAQNDILFFTDATAMHPPDALRILVGNFADESVGCATGRFIFKVGANAVGQGLTTRNSYELFLRSKQSELHTLFGASGCIYALPKRHYVPLRPDLDSDYVEPLEILRKGYRTVYEPNALAYIDRPPPNPREEFMRRSRMVLLGLRGTLYMKELMNPFKYGFLAISFVSQRLLRWLTPIYLIALYVTNLFLLDQDFYVLTWLLQTGFYGVAIGVYVAERLGKKVGFFLYLPFYFCLMMLSAVDGMRKLVRGETGQIWELVRR